MTSDATRSVIIIGAGIAGLSAGCYARMNGYRPHIFEMHTQPGGLCTSWRRKGYTIDGCIYWLVGSSPSSPSYPLWEKVGAVQGKEFLYADDYARYETEDGRTLRFPTHLDALEEHWLDFAPEDAGPIREFVLAARRLLGYQTPLGKPLELYGPMDGLRMLRQMMPYMGLMRRWVGHFHRRFCRPSEKRRAARPFPAGLVSRVQPLLPPRHAGLAAPSGGRVSGRRLVGLCPKHRAALPGPGR